MRRELCEAAKRGHLCMDDLCHTGGETLCGFVQFDYDDVAQELEHTLPEDEDPTYNDLRYQS